jgi:hypothetical protein
MLHLMFDPDGMRPFVERWDEVATSLTLARTTCWILADPLARAPGLRRIV